MVEMRGGCSVSPLVCTLRKCGCEVAGSEWRPLADLVAPSFAALHTAFCLPQIPVHITHAGHRNPFEVDW